MKIINQYLKYLKIVSVLFSRLIGAGLRFLLNVLIARMYGAEGAGLFYLYDTTLRVGQTILSFGTPEYILKRISSLQTEKPSIAVKVLTSALFPIIILGMFLSTLIYFFSSKISQILYGESNLDYVVYWSIYSAVIYCIVRAWTEAFKAKGLVNWALNIEFNIWPGMLILIILLSMLTSVRINMNDLFFYNLILLLVCISIYLIVWYIKLGPIVLPFKELLSTSASIKWGEASVFWLYSILNVISWSIPFFVLPRVATIEEIGQFGTAQKIVALSTIIVVGISSYYSPRFATLSHMGSKNELLDTFKQSRMILIATSLPIWICVYAAPTLVLNIFGTEFGKAKLIMFIMGIGHITNSLIGLSTDLLNMSGNARKELISIGVSVCVLVTFSLIFGSIWGVTGVAVSYALSIMIRSIISYFYARKLLFVRDYKTVTAD